MQETRQDRVEAGIGYGIPLTVVEDAQYFLSEGRKDMVDGCMDSVSAVLLKVGERLSETEVKHLRSALSEVIKEELYGVFDMFEHLLQDAGQGIPMESKHA